VSRKRLDTLRRRSSPVENHLIDEYAAGKISRRDFIRRGTIVGMSLPFLGVVVAACGDDDTGTTTTAAEGAGATTTTAATATTAASGEPTSIRAAFIVPARALDPVTISDEGGLAAFGQTGQYLTWSDKDLNLIPVLAESWEPNADFTEWTFNLRQGVMYHDGSEVKAADVVASIEGVLPGNAASAAQTFNIAPGGTVAVDDYTVKFMLGGPNGAFPFFTSSDNYNAAILPAAWWQSYAEGNYEQTFAGTGPWINESFEQGVSAVYTKNPNYWGDNGNQADRLEITFYGDEAAAVTAFQEGRIDVIPHISFFGGQALIDDPDAVKQSIGSAQHRQIHMATDVEPFTDPRVRQAMALMLNRQALVDGLLGGFGSVGNDHPFWVNYPATNPDATAQREQDLAAAQSLLDAAGYADGFEVTLHGLTELEMPDLGALVQGFAGQLNNVVLNLQFDDAGTYYDQYWLDSPIGITNYGHRGVPNVFLGAPLRSDGTWNAAHWQNTDYDALNDAYVAAPDLDTQRQLAGQIQQLLHEETPIVFPYFLDHISVHQGNFAGLEVTAMGHVNLINAVLTG
jgi:peptide/nickel transport system substrate-binding protein